MSPTKPDVINSLISICHTGLVGSDQACEPSEYNVMYKYLERRVAFHSSNALTVLNFNLKVKRKEKEV